MGLGNENDKFLSTVVTVSVPAMMSVGEGDGMVQVCATLSAVNDTEREFSITFATGDGTGKVYSHGLIVVEGGSVNM
jgi:hypothetical protein